MSMKLSIRLVLAVLGLAGLTVLSIVALRDLQAAYDGERTNPGKEAAGEAFLGYGQVDVEPGIYRLTPAFPGRVKEIRVRENEEVEAGALLLRLEDEPARLRLRQARAELEDAQKQLEDAWQEPQRHCIRVEQQQEAVRVARKKRDMSRRQLDKLHSWVEKALCSDRDVQDADDLMQTLDAAVRMEQARLEELKLHDPSLVQARARKLVEARQAQLELAEHDLRQYELRAPVRGKVLRILVGPGDFLAGTAGQPALEYCPDRPRIVRAEVGQDCASRLSPGQRVVLQDDEVPGLQWRGEVRRVSDWLALRRSAGSGLQDSRDQRMAECIIEPESGPQRLRMGQKFRVMLTQGGR